jgi:hypothetical protein
VGCRWKESAFEDTLAAGAGHWMPVTGVPRSHFEMAVAELRCRSSLAVNGAREVGAAMMELRAGMRSSRLWQNQGRKEQARELLSAAYSKITEGFTTADMKKQMPCLPHCRHEAECSRNRDWRNR